VAFEGSREVRVFMTCTFRDVTILLYWVNLVVLRKLDLSGLFQSTKKTVWAPEWVCKFYRRKLVGCLFYARG
jgi:hypothetical protein